MPDPQLIREETMTTCYHCAQLIGRGRRMILVVPPTVAKLAGDFDRTYHPGCYARAEAAAAKELATQIT